MQTFDTVIVGAGVAGLGCARTLMAKDPDHSFVIITKDVGGRITTSDDGKVNYGAYFVLDSYRHVKEFTRLRHKVNPVRVTFHRTGGKKYHLLSSFKSPLQMIRLFNIVREFKGHYEDFMKESEVIGQKKALEKHPELSRHYSQSARQYVRKHKIEKVAEDFLSEAVYSFSFVSLDDISALDLLRISTILLVPTYEFTFDRSEATAGFEDRIYIDNVIGFDNNNDCYVVRTKDGKHVQSTNLVIATQPTVTQTLLGLPRIKPGVSAHITHLRGKLVDHRVEDKLYNVFASSGDLIAIVREQDGSYIFACHNDQAKPEDYFEDIEIIAEKFWNPAFNLVLSDVLYEADRGDGLYMIGDYNITGMEDAYITGVYAANQIIKNKGAQTKS